MYIFSLKLIDIEALIEEQRLLIIWPLSAVLFQANTVALIHL